VGERGSVEKATMRSGYFGTGEETCCAGHTNLSLHIILSESRPKKPGVSQNSGLHLDWDWSILLHMWGSSCWVKGRVKHDSEWKG